MLTGPLAAPVAAPPMHQIAVLLVDDDDQYASFVQSVFEETAGLDIQLHHVRCLRDVLPKLAQQSFSVVLLDVNLPDGDGIQWLLTNRAALQAAVIVLTGDPDRSLHEGVAAAAQDFIVKFQVQPEHLVRAVRYAADRERVRQQLVRSRQYFQALIEQARDLITVVASTGRIVYQSPASSAMLGRESRALLGTRFVDLATAASAPPLDAMLASLFAGELETGRGEFEVVHADGSLRILDIVASAIASADEGPQVVVNARDVTERRHAEETLRARDEQLRQVMKMEAIGRLAGGIAHDFSNVLTVITAACERLQDDIDSGVPSSGAEVTTILSNAARAASLTRQLLAFSRKQTLSPRPIDLGQLVGNSTRLLKPLIGEHIDLRIAIDPDLPAVEADPVQMEQVLMNLAINARDAMRGGGALSLSVTNAVVTDEFAQSHPPIVAGPYVLLEVRDTGCGMSAATLARAFEPFFTTKGLEGTGLGLSTVYGIVKQSGGYIWISSEPGQGTTFTIHMPPSTAIVQADAPAPAARSPIQTATILLTEDEPDVRNMLGMLLRNAGYTVLEAENPEAAIACAASFDGRIDLLLTDVVMPGGTGSDLARQMLEIRRDLRVLFMSGYPEYGTAQEFTPGCATVVDPGMPFLAKPFTRATLIQKITDVLA